MIWDELQKENTTGVDIKSIHDLQKLLQPTNYTSESAKRAKRIVASVIQTKQQLCRACDDIIQTAAVDGVTCKYLFVNSFIHSHISFPLHFKFSG
jgi:hypothetical protein